jgi:hypothetical protein
MNLFTNLRLNSWIYLHLSLLLFNLHVPFNYIWIETPLAPWYPFLWLSSSPYWLSVFHSRCRLFSSIQIIVTEIFSFFWSIVLSIYNRSHALIFVVKASSCKCTAEYKKKYALMAIQSIELNQVQNSNKKKRVFAALLPYSLDIKFLKHCYNHLRILSCELSGLIKKRNLFKEVLIAKIQLSKLWSNDKFKTPFTNRARSIILKSHSGSSTFVLHAAATRAQNRAYSSHAGATQTIFTLQPQGRKQGLQQPPGRYQTILHSSHQGNNQTILHGSHEGRKQGSHKGRIQVL